MRQENFKTVMKKFYLSAAAVLLLAGTSVAQMNYPAKLERHIATDDDSEINNLPSSPAEKALGVTFWTNDFSTPADWTADNDGQSAPFGWNIGTTVNSWWGAFSGGINSTSGGNFAEIYNGDYNQGDQAIGVVYTLTTSSPIDVLTLAGTDQVTLSFEQFGALFNDGQKVYVSTDGLSWTEVFTNNDRTVFVGNNPSAVYSNPETVTANIANAISAANGGNPSTVWIRFEWTTRITGNMTPNAWTTFGWFIDDVALTTNADNEIEAQASWWGSNGLPYYQIPTTQIAPIDFSGIAFNGGIATQNNVQLNVDINSGAFTGSSAGVGIDPGHKAALRASRRARRAASVPRAARGC